MAGNEEPFGILDGQKVKLDESVWDLPEEDRARIIVQRVDDDGNTYEVRPFRFIGGNAVALDERTVLVE